MNNQAGLLKKDARRSISQGLGHLGPDDTQNISTLNNEMQKFSTTQTSQKQISTATSF
jgi:hypothetical protein